VLLIIKPQSTDQPCEQYIPVVTWSECKAAPCCTSRWDESSCHLSLRWHYRMSVCRLWPFIWEGRGGRRFPLQQPGQNRLLIKLKFCSCWLSWKKKCWHSVLLEMSLFQLSTLTQGCEPSLLVLLPLCHFLGWETWESFFPRRGFTLLGLLCSRRWFRLVNGRKSLGSEVL